MRDEGRGRGALAFSYLIPHTSYLQFRCGDHRGVLDFDAGRNLCERKHGEIGEGGFKKPPERQAQMGRRQHDGRQTVGDCRTPWAICCSSFGSSVIARKRPLSPWNGLAIWAPRARRAYSESSSGFFVTPA